MKKLEREFYNQDSLIVAKELLGKVLVHETGGQKISAKIVETEAYIGIEDKAAHSYGGKRTPRVEVMYGGPWIFLYIYDLWNALLLQYSDKGRRNPPGGFDTGS